MVFENDEFLEYLLINESIGFDGIEFTLGEPDLIGFFYVVHRVMILWIFP